MAQPVFSICPRGFGASSYRLYESLAFGCIPVIVSDKFIFPDIDEDWSSFSITVGEKDLYRIPELINNCEQDVDLMSKKAREVWDKYFSPAALKKLLVAEVRRIMEEPEIIFTERILQKLERFHFGAYLKDILKK